MARNINRHDQEFRISQRLLSGEPFTHDELPAGHAPHLPGHHDPERVVDGLIGKLRRSGQISFKRIDGRVVRTATANGRTAIGELAA